MRSFIAIACVFALALFMAQSAAARGYNRIWDHPIVLVDYAANAPNVVNVPYSSCGAAGDHFNISTVTGNEWPPVAGSPLVLNITGDVDEKVTSGTYNLEVTYFGITIINQNGDLSEFLTLPAGPGEIVISYTEDLPSSAPAGPYVVTVTANDQNKEQLLCLTVKFTLGSKDSLEERTSQNDNSKLEFYKRWLNRARRTVTASQ